MPLILTSHSSPSIKRISDHSPLKVITEANAKHADIRPLRIGLMNNMPDAALRATEEQFLRLIGSEPVLQIEPVLFTAPTIPRLDVAKRHIDQFYSSFNDIKRENLDGLIISGANFGNGSIDGLPFWNELKVVIDWAEKNVASTLTSCLATHAVMKHKYNVGRTLNQRDGKDAKIWGVFPHEVENQHHPLVSDMNSDILVPHSRWNDVSREDFEKTGHIILMASKVIGVHLAVSRNFRWVMLQGHPEYDTVSLAREYLRDKKEGETHEPANYMNDALKGMDVTRTYTNSEVEKLGMLRNNWRDSAHVMMARWMALVCNITNFDIQRQYMDGIDPEDPLRSIRQ